jgi:hypothetical protein
MNNSVQSFSSVGAGTAKKRKRELDGQNKDFNRAHILELNILYYSNY